MKKLQILLFVLISNVIFCQNKVFLYEYKSIPDSTNKQNIKTEMMVLNINKDKSEFYSLEKFQMDSINLAESQKAVGIAPPPPPQKKMNSNRVIKHINSKNIEFITQVLRDKYDVSQEIDLKWQLKNEFETILGYKVQKATTDFAGRKWVAWFTKEIPIQDGPYKFSNLPGLILKIEDSEKYHIFELKAIRKGQENFTYPKLKNGNQDVKISYPQYVKIYQNYRQNPAGNLAVDIPDYKDESGKLVSQAKLRKEVEKMSEEEIAKDNNILEIDLLKN